jgi:triacylglycerol lipase
MSVSARLPLRLRSGARARRLAWRIRDYWYVGVRQVYGAVFRAGADSYRNPRAPRTPTIVLLPGVYESWTFLRPLAKTLSSHDHPVHVLPTLGYNRGPVPAAAALLGEYLADEGLERVVLVAHSKGGLIGKLAMIRHDPGRRILGMVAIATPFAGSQYARWVPLPAVRAFVPTDGTLVALAAEREVNARIVSVYPRFDPHIPAGSALDGAAANLELETPGHFRVLADPRLVTTVHDAVHRLEGTR